MKAIMIQESDGLWRWFVTDDKSTTLAKSPDIARYKTAKRAWLALCRVLNVSKLDYVEESF